MPDLLLLNAHDVEQALDPGACTAAVEAAFRARGLGHPQPGGVLSVSLAAGGFHVKAAALAPDRGYFVAKLNGNFPGNPARGLPTIQGLLLLADAGTGTPLAVMDSAALTRLRTAAATAVAADHLARPDADTAAIVGCGAQALDQLTFVHRVRPLRRALAYDTRPEVAARFAARASAALRIPVIAAPSLDAACRESAIIITCTTAQRPFLGPDLVAPGAFVAAVGADHPEKQELEPALLGAAAVVTDVTAQCAEFGELHHALAAGVVRLHEVRAELGDVVAGTRRGRLDERERVVFDSTGTPIQDAAAAGLVYDQARGRQ